MKIQTATCLVIYGLTCVFSDVAAKQMCTDATLECFTRLKEENHTVEALKLGMNLLNRHLETKKTKPVVLTIQVAELLHEIGKSAEAESFLFKIYQPTATEKEASDDIVKANVLKRLATIYLDRRQFLQAASASREEVARRLLAGYAANDRTVVYAQITYSAALIGLKKFCEAGVVLQSTKAGAISNADTEVLSAINDRLAEIERERKSDCAK